jgi:hypothetical protein
MSILHLGDKLGDMQQTLLDRMNQIEVAKQEAADRHVAATAAMRDAHNAFISTLDAQIAVIRDMIGG